MEDTRFIRNLIQYVYDLYARRNALANLWIFNQIDARHRRQYYYLTDDADHFVIKN